MNIHEFIKNNACLLCNENANITLDSTEILIADCPACGKFAITRELYDDIFCNPHIHINKKAFADYLISLPQDKEQPICFCEIESNTPNSKFKMVSYRRIRYHVS